MPKQPEWIEKTVDGTNQLVGLAGEQNDVLKHCKDAIIDACYELTGAQCKQARVTERCEECPVRKIDELVRTYETGKVA